MLKYYAHLGPRMPAPISPSEIIAGTGGVAAMPANIENDTVVLVISRLGLTIGLLPIRSGGLNRNIVIGRGRTGISSGKAGSAKPLKFQLRLLLLTFLHVTPLYLTPSPLILIF